MSNASDRAQILLLPANINKMNRILFPSILMLLSFSAIAQNTIGVFNYDATKAHEGYNLYYPHGQQTVWLLDNCGRIVHSWPDTLMIPGNSVYLKDDGSMLRCAKEPGNVNSMIQAGGAGQYVQQKDWNNNVMWQFEYNSAIVRMHHDISIMPNGNILIIAWEYKGTIQAVQAGRDTTLLPTNQLWPDHIIEVEPVGSDSANIVWEWHAWDHLIQNYDQNMDNFGVVADHPELIDLNYTEHSAFSDWLHINAIDYNPTLDQIVLSVPNFNELWIIDHSTTTAEAAGHTGGNSGMGGDLIYRWGDPRVYDTGDSSDQKLEFQHDVHWMDIELDPNDDDFGKILVFNNRIGGDHSSVDIVEPPLNGSNYTLVSGNAYGPDTAAWSYTAPIPTDLFSSGLAGAQKLNNGNFLICSGRQGWTFEIDPSNNNEIVWEFVNPFITGEPGTQGDIPGPNQNVHFRLNRYEPDHPAFNGQSLNPQGYIELQPDTVFCDSVLTVGIVELSQTRLNIYPNPTRNILNVEVQKRASYSMYDLQGRIVLNGMLEAGKNQIPLIEIPAGVYIFRSSDKRFTRIIKTN